MTTNVTQNVIKETYKMVFAIRMDLKMSKGKVAAQCCHATLLNFRHASVFYPEMVKAWENNGMAKITLKCDNLESLHELQKHAIQLNVVSGLIQDAGRTQVESGTCTVLAIGPGPSSLIDKITGHLKLY